MQPSWTAIWAQEAEWLSLRRAQAETQCEIAKVFINY